MLCWTNGLESLGAWMLGGLLLRIAPEIFVFEEDQQVFSATTMD